jgi:hypothetical protein
MSLIRSAVITLATLALCSSCTEEGKGFVNTEQRQLKSFDKVHVSDGLTVNITNGDQRVAVTTDDNLRNNIVTDVDGDTLKIRLAHNEEIDPTIIQIDVSVPALRGLKVDDKSTVNAQATQAENWHLNVDDRSHAVVTNIGAGDLYVDVTDKSSAEITGSASYLSIDCHDTSALMAEGLSATKVKVDISGESQVNVRATNEIEIDSGGNSRVFVSGNPPQRNVDADNGSSIVFNNQ